MSDRGHEQGSEQRPAATSALAIMVLLLIGCLQSRSAGAIHFHRTLRLPGHNGRGKSVAGVIADSAGNLYGIAANDGAYGHGAVFEVTRAARKRCSTAFVLWVPVDDQDVVPGSERLMGGWY